MKILIIPTSGIGNTVLATPMIQAIRRIFRRATIDVLVHPPAAELLEDWPVVDSVVPFHADFPSGSYHLALTCEPASGEHRQAAKRALQALFVKKRNFFELHEVQVNLSLAKQLGYSGDIPGLYVNSVLPKDRASYRGKIVIHLGARDTELQQRKCWRKDRWIELIERLGSKNVVLMGARDEEGMRETGSIAELTGAGNDYGKYSIAETAGLIRQSSMLITTDSGLMHVAAACGTPVVSIFGPTLIVKNHPWVDRKGKAILICPGILCSPCFGTYRIHLCDNIRCMQAIGVEDILMAIEDLKKADDGQLLIRWGKSLTDIDRYKSFWARRRRALKRFWNNQYARVKKIYKKAIPA